MKLVYSFIFAAILFFNVNAQTPQGFNYQGVARNATGIALINQTIGLEISILNGSATGTAVYTETHNLTTDASGLFSLTIGSGTATLGTFTGINWAVGGSKWLKISMDAAGGTNYQLIGSSQLMSVPYALFAGNVTNNGGKQTLVLSDNVTDVQAAAIIAAEVGPNTQEIKIVGTTNLTTVNLSMITTAINIEINDNTALTSVDLSGLSKCDGVFTVVESPLLNNLNISALSKINSGFFDIQNTAITTLNLPNLTKVSGYFELNDNPNLNNISMPNLISVATFSIVDNSSLTNINFPSLTKTLSLSIENCPLLNSINFSNLVSCNGTLEIKSNAALNTFSFPGLASVNGGVNIRQNNTLTNFNFPSLTTITGSLSLENNSALTNFNLSILNTTGSLFVGGNTILTNFTLPISTITTNNPSIPGSNNFSGNNALTSISFPNLGMINSISLNNHPNLTSVNYPSLTMLTGLQSTSNPLISTINLPLVNSIGTSTTSNTTSSLFVQSSMLTNFSLPSLTSLKGGISLGQNKLTNADVNSLLAKLVAITPNITGRFISLDSQTPSAPPTGQGLIDKATLISNGNTVLTD